jgi:hypothetical protein
LFNAEFDQLEATFKVASGHNHDGTEGAGAPVPFIQKENTGVYVDTSNPNDHKIIFKIKGITLGGVNSGTPSGFGTAAFRNVMTSPTDTTTPDALMPRGAFGAGSSDVVAASNINTSTTSFRRLDFNAVGSPAASKTLSAISVRGGGANLGADLLITEDNNNPELYVAGVFGGTRGNPVKMYGANNILGTVSQSAGVPTGAIIQHIANANGKATRFADGTQISWNDNSPITIDPSNFVGTPTSVDGNKLRIGKWI